MFSIKNKLKLESYPFDWIISHPDNIIHCVKDNFAIFLDKSFYRSINEHSCGHTYYGLNIFHHHNPLLIQKEYDYFTRCVERFNNLLKKDENKIFLMMFINGEYGVNSKMDLDFKNKIITFNNEFKKYTKNYKLLIVMNYPDSIKNEYNIDSVDEIDFIEINTLSRINGVNFNDEKDNKFLDLIIKLKYNLKCIPNSL